jgi:hypothetical protein
LITQTTPVTLACASDAGMHPERPRIPPTEPDLPLMQRILGRQKREEVAELAAGGPQEAAV